MKNRFLCAILAFLLSLSAAMTAFTVPLFATDGKITPSEAANGICDFLAHRAKCKAAELIPVHLAPLAASGSTEWYIIALLRSGLSDASDKRGAEEYYSALMKADLSVLSPTEKIRVALACCALGIGGDFIGDTLNTVVSEGRGGIMSYIFGLILLDSGIEEAEGHETLRRGCIEAILREKRTDGGFSISPSIPSDIDMTAMALCALAPYSDESAVLGVIEAALSLISSRQNADGGFSSWGTESAEVCAQVILALSALGTDINSDERFIKGGNTVTDALLRCRLPDGSFCHTPGTETNDMATSQVLCAVSALHLSQSGDNLRFYDFSSLRAQESKDTTAPSETTATPDDTTVPDTTDSDTTASRNETTSNAPISSTPSLTGGNIKLMIICAISALALVFSATALLISRKNIKSVCTVALVAAVGVLFFALSDIKTPDEFKAQTDGGEKITVCLTVRAETDITLPDTFGENNAIVTNKSYTVPKGFSAYDLLLFGSADSANGFSVTASQSGEVYIRGIGGLNEFDAGALSGWIYTINGSSPAQSSSRAALSDGDIVEFVFYDNAAERIFTGE